MLTAWLMAATLTAPLPDMLLDDAIESFHRIDTYRVIIRSSHTEGTEHFRYYYRKPGFVRIDFISPHEGAVLIYSPVTRRASLWPFGIGHFPRFDLSPGNPLILSPRGQRVDRSDVGTLFGNIRAVQARGSTEILGEEPMNGGTRVHLSVVADNNAVGGDIPSYELWLDKVDEEHLFPAKVISRDRHGNVIETVTMEAPEINVPLQPTLFDPE